MPSTTPRRRLYQLTLVVLLATFCGLAIGQYAAARWWYGSAITAAERRDALGHARAAQHALTTQIDTLRRTVRDYGVWNELYDYMRGRNPAYFDNNWGSETFANLPLETAAFVTMDGRVVRVLGYDRAHNAVIPPPAGIAAAVGRGGLLSGRVNPRGPTSGFALIDGVVYCFGVSSILPSMGTETARPAGYLYVFRALDAAFIRTLSDTVDARVAVGVVPGSINVGAVQPIDFGPLQIDDTRDDIVDLGFTVAEVAPGKRLQIHVTDPRPLRAASAVAARALLWSTIVIGALVTLFTVLFFERRLLRPLQDIAHQLVEIGEAQDPAARLSLQDHDDEIGIVNRAANRMLARLEAAQRSADAARDAALVASRVKSEFLARMSHEIRTPMNGVLGMTELMERTEMTARQRKFCGTIHRSASSLLDIINDILDFSKIEAHKLEIEPIECELAPLVEETMELLSTRAQGRELELIVDVQPSVPALVCIDPVRLRQVLTNLIGNAIKFTEHGEVVVTVTGDATVTGRTRLTFSVTDTGIGIAPEAQARLFEPFSQADASTTRRFGGTGLGLAIAHQLVELMGGGMRIDSALGRGSTFSFGIEVAVPETPRRGDDATRLLDGLRILVGDEHQASRELLTRQLESAGAIVVAAASADALPRILATQETPFDLLLLDQPITGVVVARHPGPAPIITMAAAAESGAGTELGSDSGVAGYLTKPVRQSLLIATIARISGRGANLDQAHFLSSVGRAASGERLGLNVLLVEDNPVNQAVAIGMLEALGCRGEIAGHGGEALERIAAGGIDVVLMDFQMPFMDGITATRRLREREAANHAARLPVIGVSAHAMQGAREECLIAGMNDFISKPFTMAELARVLRRHARRSLRAVPSTSAALPPAAPAVRIQGR